MQGDVHCLKGQTHRPSLRERLHELHPLCVDLDEGQQVPGLNRLKQLDHFSCRRRARLPRVLVVHILSVDELLPHRPAVEGKCRVFKVLYERRRIQRSVWILNSQSTYMSLEGVGFGEGEGRFPSMISLKLLFPTFLASWVRKRERSVIGSQ